MPLQVNSLNEPIAIGDHPIHQLANRVPMASKGEQEALQLDIDANGQVEPIILYRGHIVDGRCRTLACEALGIDVNERNLPNNMSLLEVADFVKSVNTRRNLLNCQKAIVAARELQTNPKLKGKVIAKSWGISENEVSAAKYLNVNHKAVADQLFKGKRIEIDNDRPSLSVQSIAKYLKLEFKHRYENASFGSTPHAEFTCEHCHKVNHPY